MKGLARPAVVLYCAVRYAQEIRKLLGAIDAAVRRLRGAKGFGVELELEAKIAEQTSIEAEREQPLKTLPGIEPPNVKGASQ